MVDGGAAYMLAHSENANCVFIDFLLFGNPALGEEFCSVEGGVVEVGLVGVVGVYEVGDARNGCIVQR